MSLKDSIISFFPFLYTRKHFSKLDASDFTNYAANGVEPELLLLPFFLKIGEVFVDVGSNKGAFIHAASKITGAKNVIAFEPNPVLFRKLRAVFKQANIFDYALSAQAGDAVLNIPFTDADPDDSLGHLQNGASAGAAFSYNVKVETMDHVLAHAEKIALVKIDVEGNEQEVIMGSLRTIARFRPVLIVEIEQRHHRETLAAIINKKVVDLNYSVYYFSTRTNQLTEYDAATFDLQQEKDLGTSKYINNFIFIPREKDPRDRQNQINKTIGNASRK